MHADEVVATTEQVGELVAAQFPALAGAVRPVGGGTDNVLFRVGDELVARMPRIPDAVGQVAFEARWLPTLTTLTASVPVPVATGVPGAGYPWPWALCRWIDGEDAWVAGPPPASDLRLLLRELRAVPAAGGPPPRGRGGPLLPRDEEFRACLAQLRDDVDTVAAQAVWNDALAAEPWTADPVWVHGDLLPGNVLVRGGRLAAVIDWGAAAVGDPAVDLLAAWSLCDEAGRSVLRDEVEEDTWRRGRGWAVSLAAIALPYYRHTNPLLAGTARRIFAALLD